MSSDDVRLVPLIARTVIVHTVSYVFVGALAASLLDYQSTFARAYMACWMRQFPDPMIMAGPLFQPVRGVLFALVIYPLREVIFPRRFGWLVLFWVLVALGVLSTFGPAPGSVEGFVYTVIPARAQMMGYLEVIPQAFLLAFGVVYWTRHSQSRLLTWLMVAAFVIAMSLPVVGLLVGTARG